jgi:hypothetical protein
MPLAARHSQTALVRLPLADDDVAVILQCQNRKHAVSASPKAYHVAGLERRPMHAR